MRSISTAPADLDMHKAESLPEHPNGMMLEAFDGTGRSLYRNVYFSIGGGAVLDRAAITARQNAGRDNEVSHRPVPYAFSNAAELLAQCRKHGLTDRRDRLEERADLSRRGGDAGAAASKSGA